MVRRTRVIKKKIASPDFKSLHAEHRRIRLLYSLGDFQLALSAVAFLTECDPNGKYSKVELRRYRCFETALIIAYARPFSRSEGGVPPLTLKMAKAHLTEEQKALHRRLIRMRNKVIAHSDRELMRMTTQAHNLPLRDGEQFFLVEMVFDEGITLLGGLLLDTDALIHKLYRAVFETLHEEAQKYPELFNLRLDYEFNESD
jgi:hypothetical protein